MTILYPSFYIYRRLLEDRFAVFEGVSSQLFGVPQCAVTLRCLKLVPSAVESSGRTLGRSVAMLMLVPMLAITQVTAPEGALPRVEGDGGGALLEDLEALATLEPRLRGLVASVASYHASRYAA